MWTTFFLLIYNIVAFAVVGRVLIRSRMEPSVRLAWIMVILAIPVAGIIAYLLFGEVRMSQAEKQRMADVRQQLTGLRQTSPDEVDQVISPLRPILHVNQSVGGMPAMRGNRIDLLPEGDEAMDQMVAAVDAATDHVHICFYIWLPDGSGTKMADAIVRAAKRGVACRLIIDEYGSRAFERSDQWKQMKAAGAECVIAFPTGNVLVKWLFQRLDLRNHRKIMVVDNRLAFTGSRNCSDMSFYTKPKYAPWVDILTSVEGPVVRELQSVFLADWMSYTGEDRGDMLEMVEPVEEPGVIAQVVATGPDHRVGSISDCLVTAIHNARREITITTPYYVPDTALDAAIRSAARRGVSVTMILPKRNDSLVVGATSEGFFHGLLKAGVRIHLFKPGLLHAKITSIDGRYSMIGSANLDRRSFEINYEVNMALYDEGLTRDLIERQNTYIERADELRLEEVREWSVFRRIRNNLMALASPLL